MREESQTLTVTAPVRHSAICSSESMHALPDPANEDQAVILNVPFFVDGLNFGDIVRLGPPDDIGIRPIEAVVTPSGHARYLVSTGPFPADELIWNLHECFPEYALRIEGDGDGLLAISLHPDLDPFAVALEVIGWFEDHGVFPGDDRLGLSALEESEVGPLR